MKDISFVIDMDFNELTDKMCIKAARVCRTLKKPELRAKIDVECDIYPDSESESPVINTKIKGTPKIKVLDLVLGLVAIRAIYRLLREIFAD